MRIADLVGAAPVIHPEAIVTWEGPRWRRNERYVVARACSADGVVWGLIGESADGRMNALRAEGVVAALEESESVLADFLRDGVDGGLRVPKIKCLAREPDRAYWSEALAFLPDGRACKRLGRPLYRLSVAKGSYLSVDRILSSEAAEAKVWTSFAVDRVDDLVAFSVDLSSVKPANVEIPLLGDWPDPPAPTDDTEFLGRARMSIVGEFPHEGLKVLPTDAVAGYMELLESEDPATIASAVMRIGNALGVPSRGPMKARRLIADDFNRPFDRVSSVVELAFRRVVQFGLFSRDVEDEDLAAAFGPDEKEIGI